MRIKFGFNVSALPSGTLSDILKPKGRVMIVLLTLIGFDLASDNVSVPAWGYVFLAIAVLIGWTVQAVAYA